ncbi:SGNH/GDSL hydrolase family protein [Microlunatus sp. Y2014]|uniref:SGNH/GDSL hydrolase family protein n=1 Tax=Microlunatus sp. Y2014 TaxID=3418488 RepID=UPI003DA78309
MAAPSQPRFVAIGDSFTEGVGDWNEGYPNGVRGWSDRVAKHLVKAQPELRYANLAIRSRRLRQILDEQLEPALALRPTLVSFFAGGNDLLDFGTDPHRVVARCAEAVARITDSGAKVIMFTSYDLRISRLLEPFRPRNDVFNDGIIEIARKNDAILVDHRAMSEYEDPRLWSADRMHMSKDGHKLMAARVLDTLGVPWSFDLEDFDAHESIGWWTQRAEGIEFWRRHLMPVVGRRLRRVTLGDHLDPKWPELVNPAEGLRKLEKKRRKQARKAAEQLVGAVGDSTSA